MKIKLSEIVEEMEKINQDLSIFLELETGHFYAVSDDDFRAVEDMSDLSDFSNFLDWEKEHIRKVIHIEYHHDQFIKLPDSYDIHEHQLMVTFAQTLQEPLASELINMLYRKKAFRSFKDFVNDQGIEKMWYQFKEKQFYEIAKTWCERHGLDYE